MASGPRRDSRQLNNHLLQFLPAADLARIKDALEFVELPHGQTLIKADSKIEHVYFPESGMISLVQNLNDGAIVEVGLVGMEGMAGTPLILGADRWTLEAMVQMPGAAHRLPAETLLEVTERNAAFRKTLLRYTQSLFSQVTQTASCNARHNVDQRLARWLLMAHDRADGPELPLSHEFISMMLGIRRAGVTTALGAFKTAKLLTTGLGRVIILDRPGLERTACECYRAVKEQSSRLLRRPPENPRRG